MKREEVELCEEDDGEQSARRKMDFGGARRE
jgi:hypothetical protein